MPTYDYRCPVCNHTREIFHCINTVPKVQCLDCGADMKKLVGAPPHKFIDPRGTCGKQATGRTRLKHS